MQKLNIRHQDLFPQGAYSIFRGRGWGAEIFSPGAESRQKNMKFFLPPLKKIFPQTRGGGGSKISYHNYRETTVDVCPLFPSWELFSSGAETYYFEFHQGHSYWEYISTTPWFESSRAYAPYAPLLYTPLCTSDLRLALINFIYKGGWTSMLIDLI